MSCGVGWKSSAFWARVSQENRPGEVEVNYNGDGLKVLTFGQNIGCKQESEFVFRGDLLVLLVVLRAWSVCDALRVAMNHQHANRRHGLLVSKRTKWLSPAQEAGAKEHRIQTGVRI